MYAAAAEKDFIKGGAFLIEDRATGEIFTPEDFTDEHKMIGDTMREFVDNEVRPAIPAMEQHDWETARRLVQDEDGGLNVLRPVFHQVDRPRRAAQPHHGEQVLVLEQHEQDPGACE